MYKSSQPQVAFEQSSAPGNSDNEWNCATPFIQGIRPAWNADSSWNRYWSRDDANHSSGTGNGHPLKSRAHS